MTRHQPPTALPRAVLDRADVRAALAAHDFGTVFRLARSEAGISYSKIAAECDIKPDRVGTLARGTGNITSYQKIAQIADALRIPGRLIGLTPRDWEPSAHSRTMPPRTAHPENGDDVRRRDFSLFTAAAGLATQLPALARPRTGRRVGSETPDRLRERTARLRRLDDVLGGGDTYPVYLGEYLRTKALLRDTTYSEATGKALLSVLAEQAQQAGWAAFDGGKHTDAAGLYEVSHEAAVEAGDTALAGNALAFLAYQKLTRDRHAGVETASRSCAALGPNAAACVRALLFERLAWAHAVAGNATEAERALHTAQTALTETGDEQQPDWVAWMDETELQIMTGRCWTELRRPLRAVPVLEAALASYDDVHARDKSLYLSWLAEAYATAGEFEQAAMHTGRALDLCTGVASVRPRQRLTPVLKLLADHPDATAVAEVLEKAQAA
ncbi:hypothetical protein SRB5_16160 [Streptomyces sp. RB5]|uniref:Uncharacterized protein n=1 Tax=Streptomyces smaragdinus TaxID=2585196 RepID=A0A7K0CDF5_9ACTN|nr:helix-turn-helix transcriptional regulator [Streptomyces smaragdinus]MQY11497.1 hypothetical protein [Streptomyces smaragdinus]